MSRPPKTSKELLTAIVVVTIMNHGVAGTVNDLSTTIHGPWIVASGSRLCNCLHVTIAIEQNRCR
jgi:hypothetical protein